MIEFPKSEAVLYKKVNDALECDDFDLIYKCKDEIIKSYNIFKHTNIFVSLVKSMFYKEKYTSVVSLVTDLQIKEYEKNEMYFYLIASCLALEDIYQAASVVKKSKLMNSADFVIYWNDEATYSSLINCSDDIRKTGVIAKFLKELLKETSINDNLEEGYIGIRYFELVNTLWEIGFPEEFIKELIDIANVIFMKEEN